MNIHTHEVDFKNFESVVDSNDYVILDFWAGWCGPCKIFAPVFEALAQAHPEIYFGKVNTEDAQDLAAAFQVRSIPTIIVFKKAELVFEHAGLLAPADFESLIQKLKE